MILSNKLLKSLIKTGDLKVVPKPVFKDAMIKIHLSNDISLNLNEHKKLKKFILKPKGFVLAKSKENISISKKYAAFYDGYTHLARKGVITHMGSMFVYPGTKGNITLEIFNASDSYVILKEGDRVGHLVFFEVGY